MTTSNPLDATAWERHEVEHVGQFLMEHFEGAWPETARLYDGTIDKEHDVTPAQVEGEVPESEVERLEELDGPVWCVVYPGTGIEVAVAISAVALIASVAAILLIPDIPSIKSPKERSSLAEGSPNNSLSARANQARPEQRVPHIYGTVKSIPDSIMVPYITYEDHTQVETGYYCIGVSEFEATAPNTRDGATRIDQVPESSCHVYGPGQAPTGTGPFTGPVLAIGPSIADPVLNVFQIDAVNGQSIEPFNSKRVYGAAKFSNQDGSYTNSAGAIDYQNFFTTMAITFVNSTTGTFHLPWLKNQQYIEDRIKVGDRLFLFAQTLLASSAPIPNLQTSTVEPFTNAVTVVSMTPDAVFDRMNVTVSIPAALTTEWNKVPAYRAGLTLLAQQTTVGGFDCPFFEVTPLTDLYIGPFFVDFEHDVGTTGQAVICNFVAANGLYMDDGVVLQVPDCRIGVEIAPADTAGVITGAWQVQTTDLIGSDVTDGQRAITLRFAPSFAGRFLIRARRVSSRQRRAELPTFVEAVNYPDATQTPPGQRAYTGRINDEVRWTHCYSVSIPPNISFGDVTTVHTRTVASNGASKIRERELNLVVTRKINTWNGATFAGPSAANANAENVLFSIMKDSTIGNRTDAEIDFVGIAAAMSTVRSYFNNSTLGTLVSYTFDDFNTSFEETVTAIATMAFCTIYRQGNVLKCKPEIETDLAGVAFNHRNILPSTQKIQHTFGSTTENDCTEVDYFDPRDDSITHVRWPLFGSFVSPRTVQVIGLRTRVQAIWHAARAYQKMVFQRQSLEMKCTQEAGSVLTRDRILVADVTLLSKQSGHVVEVSGLSLRLSQPPSMPGPGAYTMFLNHPDNTVEGIAVTGGAGAFDVTLAGAPAVAIITDSTLGLPTIYTIVKDDESMPFAYLCSEQSAESNMVFNVNAVNYSNMYYLYDGMALWVQKQGPRDEGPNEHTLTVDHSFSTFSDPVRGTMLVADGSNSFNVLVGPGHTDIIDITKDYAVACWINHTSDTGSTEIATTSDNTTRFFGFFDNLLSGGHNGGAFEVQAACPTATTLHVGINYRISDGRMGLFINGALVSVATGVAAPTTPLALKYMRIFKGRFDNLMVWRRYVSDRAMMEICLKTKI
jgi:hypothetical protein